MKTCLLAATMLILLISACFAQDGSRFYTINSLEGIPQKVTVTDGGPASDELSIGFKKTKVTITNYWALNKVTVVKNRFLKIDYAVRGGSCVGVGYVIVLCVSHDKLVVPIHIHTMQSGCGADEDDMYTLKFDITGSNINDFKLNMRIHDKKDIRNPKYGKSYDKHWAGSLNFDPQKAIFFNSSKALNGSFITGFTESDKPIRQNIKGVYQIATIKGTDEMYYYIDGYWREQGGENYLLKNYK